MADETLQAVKSSCSSKARSALGHLFCPHMGDVPGASAQFFDETRSLLRSRLRASAILLMGAVALFFVRGLLLPEPQLEVTSLLMLLLLAAAAFVLHRPFPLSLTRLRILELLKTRELCVSEIAERFTMTQPSISHHLDVLKRAGLVAADKRGREVYYRFQRDAIVECCCSQFRLLDIEIRLTED